MIIEDVSDDYVFLKFYFEKRPKHIMHYTGRGRENKENERNMEDGVRDNNFAGNRRGRGGPRAGRGGRGGGRGLGPRTFANRNDTVSTSTSHSFNRPIETWTGSEEQQRSLQEPKMGRYPMWEEQ